MSRHRFAEFACSLARSLDVVGDTWTPLILRDVFLGVDTFNDIVRDLGLSRALLTDRLALLVREGVLDEVEYSERPRRVRYTLTESGRELVPILVALTQWGDRWRSGGQAPVEFTHDCGAPLESGVTCDACGSRLTSESLTPRPGPGGRAAPGTVVIAERLTRGRT
ncbi:HxlR family transcriptional regulator [Nocardiopsis sp. Huas11]|uniref:winged helix-turn-helix transcriptional regulator n=1 Tax=Nocardiopsis sp. Huas11 TaxID=2183912 RepID=UPI000EAC45BF|nr:helix-turn-helix domain-containing protein [Nocardiopsis sp. Huas11]RKS10806.1 HxlR family transcriptional regulator [Nocardiopsis sp. Huas11]